MGKEGKQVKIKVKVTPKEVVDFLLEIKNQPQQINLSLGQDSLQLFDQRIEKKIQNELEHYLQSKE